MGRRKRRIRAAKEEAARVATEGEYRAAAKSIRACVDCWQVLEESDGETRCRDCEELQDEFHQ